MELKRYLDNLYRRVIISLLFLIVISFALKNNYFYENIYNIIHYETIDFSYFNSKYRFLLGRLTDTNNIYVSSENLIYKDIKKIGNSYELITDYNLVINNINPGVVTFIGNIDNLGYTIIVEGDNNIDYWYSNIENISVNLYDHIEKNIIGNTIDNRLILTLKKDNEFIDYEGLL